MLVSSHLMSEMELTADHLVVIGRGRMIADVTASELDAMGRQATVLVRADDSQQMRSLLSRDGVTITGERHDGLSITGIGAAEIGRVAADAGIALSELTSRGSTLEETFMDLTAGAVDYNAHSIGEAA